MDRAGQRSAAALMGWAMLAILGAATLAALAVLRGPRPLWRMVGAALMLGAAGYALQGRPALPGSPARPIAMPSPDDAALGDLRDRMFGRFTGDGAWLVAADAMTRTGDRRAAVQAVLAGIRHFPTSAALWTALGNAYAEHDGQMSPPALFAFQQAMRLAPTHPGPPFFAGVVMLQTGDFAQARRYWAWALALAPMGTSYRQEIAVRLALLDRLLAMRNGRPR